MNKFDCVKSVRIRSFSVPYSVQCRKTRTRETPNTDILHAVFTCPLERISFAGTARFISFS